MNLRFALIFTAALAVLATHASASTPLQVTEQRNAAVGFALTGYVALERMEKSCSIVPEASSPFSDARRQWISRNKSYVDAANGWMDYVKSLITQEKGSQVAEAFISNTYNVFSDQASMLAAESLPGSPPLAADCIKWVGILNSKQFDFDKNPEFSLDLKEIRAFYESGIASGGR
jgi:hypothetical protein